jgi:hypothetical protein
MIYCQHRVNSIEALKQTSPNYGIEMDLRSRGNQLVLHHDPFSRDAVPFTDWLKHYKHRLLILNIKEEGLEQEAIRILSEFYISDYFFLDQSFPFLIKTLKSGEPRTAVRFSEYESLQTIQNLLVRPTWVWIDSFEGDWEHLQSLPVLKNLGFKTCLVSPELQGRNLDGELELVIQRLAEVECSVDAICTKNPMNWAKYV